MARRAMTEAKWSALFESYSNDPGAHTKAAKLAGIDRRTAAKAWSKGLTGWGNNQSISQLVHGYPEPAAEWVALDRLKGWKDNPREHDVESLVASMTRFGFGAPIVARKNGEVIAGHGRLAAATKLAMDRVPVRFLDLTAREAHLLALADNRLQEKTGWELPKLFGILGNYSASEAELAGWSKADIDQMGEGINAEPKGSLAGKFLWPPFSVLDARQGAWQDRKRQWKALGIRSEQGRGETGLYGWQGALDDPGSAKSTRQIAARLGSEGYVSIFDPVLAELMYKWFCPPSGLILDPFAGGSVRGIVAAHLGYQYLGIDLSEEQVEENRAQAVEILDGEKPVWTVGDSNEVLDSKEFEPADFLFSCPPYAYFEKYSDDARDLSNMRYKKFLSKYREIISKSVDLLKNDSFACFVVGEIRGKNKSGTCKGFVADTVTAFLDAGAQLYNDAILITAVGSLPLRAGKQFEKSRKLGKHHQNVFVFCKGDPVAATNKVGPVEVGDIVEDDTEM